MFGIGAPELLVIVIIALFVLGPERLPGLARDVGRAMNELRRTSDELTGEFMRADQPQASAPAPVQAPAVSPEATDEDLAISRAAEGDQPTAFDQKSQEEADRAREQPGPSLPGAVREAPPEPERWG